MIVSIVAHDSGGAELLSSYVRQQKLNCKYSLAGPAIPIFERKLGSIQNLPLEEALSQSDWLLCGTGWQTDFEWFAIKKAKEFKMRSAAFLDHWVNYLERFTRNGSVQFPDEIWVGDEAAYGIAKNLFQDVTIKQLKNPYFIDLKKELDSISKEEKLNNSDGIKILYVCEPIESHDLVNNKRHDYNEHDALRFFLTSVKRTSINPASIVVRPHPSEGTTKYQWILREFDLPLSLTREKSLLAMIVESDMVVGCESMAMVVGLLANKKVMSSIPPNKGVCSLPFPEIKYAHELSRGSYR